MLDKPGLADGTDATKRLCLCVGKNIRRARSRQGISQADLGQALGIEASLITSYEAGLEKVSPAMLYKIAVTLDTTLASLFDMPGS